jgi:hypothetical protein
VSALFDDISLRLLAKGWSIIPGTPSDQRILTRGRQRLGMRLQEDGRMLFQLGQLRVELDPQQPNFAPFGDWPEGLGMLFWEAARSPRPEATAQLVAEESAESRRVAQFPGHARLLTPMLVLWLGLWAYFLQGQAEAMLVWGADLPALSWHGQPWRWVSSSWLNPWGGWLAFQLYWLARWAGYLERWFNGRSLLAILSLAALASAWVQESALLSFGSAPWIWGAGGAYLAVAGLGRKRLPRAQRPIWPWEVPLVLGLELYLTQQWTSPPHWAAALVGLLAGLLYLKKGWSAARDVLRGLWALTPAALIAVLWCAWRYPNLDAYPSRSLGGGKAHYSLQVPNLFAQQDKGWTAPGVHLILDAQQLGEAECTLHWPSQSERVWQLWRESAMEWAAVERMADFRFAGRVWLMGHLRALDDKRPALCALTVDHDCFYSLTFFYQEEAQRDYFRRWLKTFRVRSWPASYYAQQAERSSAQGALALAGRLYDRAHQLDPNDFDIAMQRMWLRYSLEWAQPEEAAQLVKLAQTESQRLSAQRLQATVVAQTQLLTSRKLYQQLLAASPSPKETSKILNSWAWSEAEHGDPELAWQKIQGSLRIDKNPAHLDTYATVLMRMGQFAQALQVLQSIASLQDQEVYVLHRAQALEGLGQYQQAIQWFELIEGGSSRYARRARAHHQALLGRGLVKTSEATPDPAPSAPSE